MLAGDDASHDNQKVDNILTTSESEILYFFLEQTWIDPGEECTCTHAYTCKYLQLLLHLGLSRDRSTVEEGL